MNMVTPPKLPANDSPSPLMRSVVMSSGLLAFGMVVALSLPTPQSGTARPEAAKPEPVLTAENAAELCQQLFEEPKEYIDDAAKRRRWDLRRESCKVAFEANPANADFKAAYARNLPYAQKAEAVAMLREAAAQGSAEANYQLYEHHKSWDRGDLDHVPLVTRDEAGLALHKAAELGHPFATQMLIRRLEDGDIVKRDPVAARYWAERAVANPAKDASKGSLLVTLGRLLATSDKPDERARGLDILERMAKADVFGAKRELAIAIRKQDPVRARALLEESRRPDPGGAIVPLAEMLIAGEGGAADPKRALSLLKGTSDSWMAKGMLGQLTLEGKLVPRDIQEAVTLIDRAGTWDFNARMQVVRLLAEYPQTRVSHPKRTLYDAVQAAELDEPGAMAALIELKLSANAQFQDRPGACKLIEAAVSRGDQTMAQRLADCRAN
ncbi:sel1 repeat family protein [Bradyrhizobium sp. AUGA SZCCT0283]|uniref:tetratricopeptide repeat protein n=1 Tax=Bradyrhizobium sp. AUGA SZCCT0283 TaxID=2807671 RepID=UPI001BABE743|nr:sel1 repeat family protein [Bradyrhizobium sp. AUGA SZCCT0283]MBR1276045.1 sel1 repeat family protein [Bradyrhizobium sp. AUGA SZCCT0283]